jgi:hypothetical protein
MYKIDIFRKIKIFFYLKIYFYFKYLIFNLKICLKKTKNICIFTQNNNFNFDLLIFIIFLQKK